MANNTQLSPIRYPIVLQCGCVHKDLVPVRDTLPFDRHPNLISDHPLEFQNLGRQREIQLDRIGSIHPDDNPNCLLGNSGCGHGGKVGRWGGYL